jgi:hypothetical protein
MPKIERDLIDGVFDEWCNAQPVPPLEESIDKCERQRDS